VQKGVPGLGPVAAPKFGFQHYHREANNEGMDNFIPLLQRDCMEQCSGQTKGLLEMEK